jgi:hypothetical protein
MIQTPALANPHNCAVDVYAEMEFSFLHTGSAINSVKYNVYAAEDGTSLEEFWLSDITAYNGDMVTTEHTPSALSNGVNYKWQATQYQTAYDIYHARGSVLKKNFIRMMYADHYTQFCNRLPADVEATDITNVEQLIPITYGTTYIEGRQYNGDTLVGAQYLEINGERRKILGLWEAYEVYLLYRDNAEYTYTSAIIIESPFTTFPDQDPDVTALKIAYRVYKNYMKTPYYFFAARSVPVLTATANVSSGAIQASGTYQQANGVSIKSYAYSLDGNSYGDVYSERLTATLREPPIGTHTLKLEVMTQDDYCAEQTADITLGNAPDVDEITLLTVSTAHASGKVTVQAVTSSPCVIYRKLVGGVYKAITGLTEPTGGAVTVDDYTTCNRSAYKYMALPFASGSVSGNAVESADVSQMFRCSHIITLAPADAVFGRPAYSAVNSYCIKLDVNFGDIKHSEGVEVSGSVGRFPAAVCSTSDYRSGELTFTFGSLGGTYTGTAAALDAFRADIKAHDTVLIKSAKGEVMLCKLSGDWSHKTEQPTLNGENIVTVKLPFVEIGDSSDLIVG